MDNEIILEIAHENVWMTNHDRLVNVYWALSQVLVFGVEGAVVEIGCHAGGTSVFFQMIIDHFDPHRELHLYDSFQGMPEPGEKDAYLVKGDRAAKADDVVAAFERRGLRQPFIHPGWFEETLPTKLPDHVAMAYLDGDFYESIMVSLQEVWRRLSPNGLILIDDYADLERNPNAWNKLPGVKAACDDFFTDKDTEPFVLVGCDDMAMAGVRKPAGARGLR
jgi:O-methyltransferase